MNKGDIVLVSFTGKEVDSNRVFDTTDEKTAKESGLIRENHVYRPIPVVVGNGELILGLEKALLEMNEGEEKQLEIEPVNAFGERRKDMVMVVALQEFRKQKINPVQGLIVEINGHYGKVQTISGGRVRVDFNSELAGKKVEYSLKVEKHVTDQKEQVEVFVQKFFPFKDKKAKTKITGEELEVILPGGLRGEIDILKNAFAKVVTESVKGIEKVKFSEEFEKEQKEEKLASTK